MAKFLTTHSTVSEIDNIIRNAQGWLVLISPYFQVSNIFLERFRDAGSKNVKITLVYGKQELKLDELQALSSVNNLSLLYYENLHAKCYCNQDNAVITSMNLYEFSEKNNREMGILLERQTDPEPYKETCAEIISIINSSTPMTVDKYEAPPTPQYQAPQPRRPVASQEKSVLSSLGGAFNNLLSSGHCIRCGESIDSDIDHPLCKNCYKAWNKFKNPDYPEEYCYQCGKRAKTTIAKPLCRTCYSKS
jgi:phosphatidylserine/phosphatidylglycerophosphate/cardiolipin synthase-like enzyme